MEPLIFSTCLAANADFIGEAVANYVSRKLQIPTQFFGGTSRQEREHLLDEGKIQVSWICGLIYVWKRKHQLPFELLVAPVMQAKRYQNRPIYFSDVIVHRESPIQSFKDLQGVTWAYNDPHSHSGCYLVRHHLATLERKADFFGKIVQSGGHQKSIQMVLNRQIDAAAIDSTVLEWDLAKKPEIRSQLRIIETLGPSPIPPWVILKQVPLELCTALQTLFLEMHEDAEGRKILTEGQLSCFTQINDQDYDLIRQMAQKAEQVPWCDYPNNMKEY